MKWLQDYLDFWLKYAFKQSDKENLSHFIAKLQERNQTDRPQKQASSVISVRYETASASSGERFSFKNRNAILSIEKGGLEIKTADFRAFSRYAVRVHGRWWRKPAVWWEFISDPMV